MNPSHSVDKTPYQKKWHRKERSGENDIPHPILSTNLLKEVSRYVTSNATGEGIEQDCSGIHSVVSVDIKHT